MRVDDLWEVVVAAGSLEEAEAIRLCGWRPSVGRAVVERAILAGRIGRGEGNSRLWPHYPDSQLSARSSAGLDRAPRL